nr:MAG TPA: protein phosphatase [Caudoviricetes sp.]
MKKYFEDITTINDLKKEYRRLIKANHPDNGGNTWVMAAINNEYENLFNELKHIQHQQAAADTTGRTKPMNETPEQFRTIIEKIINLPNIEIELCGSWIWVSGDTKTYKDTFKNLGMFWATKKKMWYWRCPEDAVHTNGKTKTMSEIREKYGSDKITKTEKETKKLNSKLNQLAFI